MLQTAVLSAAAGGLLHVLYLDVSDLAARTVNTGNQLAIDDDSAAHAGPKRHKHHVFMAFSAAGAHFAQRRRIGVVDDLYRQLAQLGKLLRHVKAAPLIEVDARLYIAVVEYRARDAHSDALHIPGADILFRQLTEQRQRNIRQQIRAAIFCPCGNFPFFHQCSAALEQAQLDGRPAEVHAKRVWLHFAHLLF